ncbi:MAG: hemolysin III family protein [Actinomycetota bacterium]
MAQSVPLYRRPKPRLRGRLHEIAFFMAIPAGIGLIAIAPGPVARAGAIVYWLALLSQFGVSASYHLGKWSERAHERMRRLDHSTIFLLIAGTYTPFCLLALQGTASLVLLAAVWIGAAAGIVTKLYRTDLNVLSGFLYIGLGWVAVFALPSLIHTLTTTELVLMITGGVLYTVGALVLATKWPNPFPRTFGFHEIWHSATIAAAGCLFAAIVLLSLS